MSDTNHQTPYQPDILVTAVYDREADVLTLSCSDYPEVAADYRLSAFDAWGEYVINAVHEVAKQRTWATLLMRGETRDHRETSFKTKHLLKGHDDGMGTISNLYLLGNPVDGLTLPNPLSGASLSPPLFDIWKCSSGYELAVHGASRVIADPEDSLIETFAANTWDEAACHYHEVLGFEPYKAV
jgi:hypothetical protein